MTDIVRKVVIPCAGRGTRLLPITKELPKEMLPIFTGNDDGGISVKPLLQTIFEQMYDTGFREFCFIVGRGKRAIEDHFTPERIYLGSKTKANNKQLRCIENFDNKILDSRIAWINQPEPKGFGDAVLKAESFVGNDFFLCHAGDTYITSKGNRHLDALSRICKSRECAAVFVAQRLKKLAGYGVLEGTKIGDRIYSVKRVVEKPKVPRSNLAIMPLYIFQPSIFKALRKTRKGVGGEIQLTDAIQLLIDWKLPVYAYLLGSSDMRLDIGTPETFWEAITASRRLGEHGL